MSNTEFMRGYSSTQLIKEIQAARTILADRNTHPVRYNFAKRWENAALAEYRRRLSSVKRMAIQN
jgi:hypothetical protein